MDGWMDGKCLDAYGWIDGRGLYAYGWSDGWQMFRCICIDGWVVDVWMHMDGLMGDRCMFRFELPSSHMVWSISGSKLPCMGFSNQPFIWLQAMLV